MQCSRTARRSVHNHIHACGAHNAFNPATALRAAFSAAPPCRQKGKTQFVSNIKFISLADLKPGRPGHSHQFALLSDKFSQGLLNADQFLNEALHALRRHRQYLDRRHALDNGEWQPSITLTHHVAVRLARRDSKEAFDRLTARQQQELIHFLDYVPKAVIARHSNTYPRMPIPWAASSKYKAAAKNPRRVLDLELRLFAKYMELSTMERVARQAVTEDIMAFIQENLDRTGTEAFGSEKTGLATPLSDIDIRIWNTHRPDKGGYRLRKRMQVLCTALSKSEKFGLAFLRDGRYPIINCQHMASGISIQIVASQGAEPQQAAVTKYLELYPALRELYPTIRAFFEMRGFNDVFSGGIGSYGQFVMMLPTVTRDTPDRNDRASLADLFLRFLNFYDNLDSETTGIAPFPRTKFRKHDRTPDLETFAQVALRRGDPVRAGRWAICARKKYEPHLLCIQDPATPDNDLGKRSSSAKHLLHTLRSLRRHLRTDLKSGRYVEMESVLENFVGRCHEVYQPRRQQMEEYGVQVVNEAKDREQKEIEEAARLQERQAAAENAEAGNADFFQQMSADDEVEVVEKEEDRRTAAQTS